MDPEPGRPLSRFDIVEAILVKTFYGATGEQLFEQVPLTPIGGTRRIEKYLSVLLQMGLLETRGEQYYTTEKGRNFIRYRRNMFGK